MNATELEEIHEEMLEQWAANGHRSGQAFATHFAPTFESWTREQIVKRILERIEDASFPPHPTPLTLAYWRGYLRGFQGERQG